MPNWKDMSNRDKDVFGAEHVMGWKWIVYSVDLGKTARIIKPPDKEGFHNHPEEFWDGITEMPVNTFHLDRFCPSTDASADCEILKKVRETWDVKAQTEFIEHLHNSIQTPRRMKYSRPLSRNTSLFYESGDYVNSAFLDNNGE